MRKLIILFALMIGFSSYGIEIEIMSYNIQNLFDLDHDEEMNDWEFLPKDFPSKMANCSAMTNYHYKQNCLKTNWTEQKQEIKLNQIKKVVKDSRGKLPDVLAIIEIENEAVANLLANKLGYKNFIITNGPDERGIDVALFFNEKSGLEYISSKEHKLLSPIFKENPTRNILETEFSVNNKDQLFVFVNHWPSQGGPTEARVKAAERLKRLVDDRKKLNPNAYVIAVGDFNTVDQEIPHPFHTVLQKGKNGLLDLHDHFYRLTTTTPTQKFNISMGTYFYSTTMTWSLLDHIFFSPNLLGGSDLTIDVSTYEIYAPKIATTNYQYSNINSAHHGTIITGVPLKYDFTATTASKAGFSDHFPVVVKLRDKFLNQVFKAK